MLNIFNPVRGIDFTSLLIKLLTAFILGTVIGLERSYHNKPAGFRTHTLVVLGAAIASLTGIYLYVGQQLPTDVSRIAAGVVTGLGFIGAGTIVVTKKQKVKGLTTAAGLWTSGLIGLATGAGFYEGALLGTLMILLIETYFTGLRGKIHVSPEFEVALSYYSRNDLDEVLRYCKDNDISIINLRVIGTKGPEAATYSALLTLKAGGGDAVADEAVKDIEKMAGIISAELI